MQIKKLSVQRKLNIGRYRRLGGEFLWVGSGQAVSVLGMVVGVRLLTGVLEPQIYGELALGMTAAMLVNQVVMGPLSNSSLRFFAPAREADEFPSFLAALRGLLIRASGVILVIAALSCLALQFAGKSDWVWLVVAAFGFALLCGYNSVLDGMQNAARQRPVVAWHQALSSWGRYLAAVGLVVWLSPSSAFVMLGYVMASILVLFSQAWFFKRKIISSVLNNPVHVQAVVQKRWETRIFSYAWPFATWGVFTWAQMVSGRWALQMFSSTQDVGLFAVLYQLGYYPITIVTMVMVQLIAPVFFQRAGDASDSSRIRYVYAMNWRLVSVALILTIAATVSSIFVHSLVFRLLVAPEYQSVSWLMPGLILSGGLFATGQFLAISLMSSNESRILIAPKIGVAILGLLMSFIGAFWFGVPGVVGASLAFSTVYMVWVFSLVRTRRNQLMSMDSSLSPSFQDAL